MQLGTQKLWQIGAGDTERDYADLCQRWDVMLAGPGRLGPYSPEAYASLDDNNLRRFYVDAKRGDAVLLRLGTGRVVALGEIADDAPMWLPAFGDVDGWDVQHVRRVRWYPGTGFTFPGKTLGGQVRTFASVEVDAVRAWVGTLKISQSSRDRKLAELPPEPRPLDLAELGRRLFIEGWPADRVDKLIETVTGLDRVARWYSNEQEPPERRPSEQETVAYFVIPLLFSLGWSHQTAAIEWRNIDIALFDRMPATDGTLQCVVEAKLMGRSVFSPVGQALDYALRGGREQCSRLIVTDGIRYAVHRKHGEKFKLTAYLNLLDIKDSNPAFECAGAVEAILAMAR